MSIPPQSFQTTPGGNLYPDKATAYNQAESFRTVAQARDLLDATLKDQAVAIARQYDEPVARAAVREAQRAATLAPVDFTTTRQTGPDRTIISKDGKTLAVLTDGCQTGVFYGPERRFPNPNDGPTEVVTSAYVHVLQSPYAAGDEISLSIAGLIHDPTIQPDVFEVATEYLDGAPRMVDQERMIVAGQAGYGQEGEDGGGLQIGADFHDYLGKDWTTPSGAVRTADPAEYQKLDCSGYVRMIYGYRLGIAIGLNEADGSIPRTSKNQAATGPGIIIADGDGTHITMPANALPGDLVFFDKTPGLSGVHHVGIVFGDAAGNLRMIHSAPGADGPTFGNWQSTIGATLTSRLTGTGYYATGITTIRRF